MEKNLLWAGSPPAKRSPKTVRAEYDGLGGRKGWGESGYVTNPGAPHHKCPSTHGGGHATRHRGGRSLSATTASTAPMPHAALRAELGLRRGIGRLRGSGDDERRTPRSNERVNFDDGPNAANSQGGGTASPKPQGPKLVGEQRGWAQRQNSSSATPGALARGASRGSRTHECREWSGGRTRPLSSRRDLSSPESKEDWSNGKMRAAPCQGCS